MLNITQLKDVMKHYLKSFNDEGVAINDNTKHNSVLSENDLLGNVNSKNLYHDAVRYVLAQNGNPIKVWPSSWMELSVNNLANIIL